MKPVEAPAPISFLRVTTTEEIRARFHGEDYLFLPGEPVDMPVDAAAHIFGFGMDEAGVVRALHRLGWLRASIDIKAARARLEAVSAEPVQQVFEIGERRLRRSRKRISSGSPPGEAEAEEGEVLDFSDEGELSPPTPEEQAL